MALDYGGFVSKAVLEWKHKAVWRANLASMEHIAQGLGREETHSHSSSLPVFPEHFLTTGYATESTAVYERQGMQQMFSVLLVRQALC